MVGLIVCGHGNFGSGMESAVNVVSGKQEKFKAVDFVEGMSAEQLKVKIADAMVAVDGGDGIIVFADICGGAPFVQASLLSVGKPKIKVFGGSNLTMIANSTLLRNDKFDDMVAELLEVGKDSIELFEIKERKKDVVPEDGI